MKKKLNKIISDEINRFINEELSISNALESAVNNAEKEILQKFVSKESVNIIKDAVNVNGERYAIQNVYMYASLYFGENMFVPCTVAIIDFPDEKVFDSTWDSYNFCGNYNKNEGVIYITINSIAGQVNKLLLRHLLFHEGEHAYQHLMAKKDSKNSDVYEKATKIVKHRDKEHNTLEFNNVASLLYYYSKMELDAHVNELYGEISNNGLDIKHTFFYQEKKLYDEIMEKVLSTIDNGQYDIVLKYFGISKDKFKIYIEAGEKYLIKKLRKCYQKAYNEMKVNENYKRKNIQSIINRVKPILFNNNR